MKLAGVSAKTADVPGGVIVRDASGTPTGIFKDAAQDLIFKAIPPLSHEQRLAAVKRALAYAAAVCVTSAQHMNAEYGDVEVYSELLEKGQLTARMARIYCAPLETEWQDQARIGLRRAWGSAHLRLGAVKGFADGSIGSRTAALFEPYSDEPSNRGILSAEMHPPESMRERLMKADSAGLQLRVHAIGDRAISMTLDTFAAIEAPLNPMLGLYAAITRATLDGKNPQGWIPEQKITLAEAVEAYTLGSAFAEFQEKEKGLDYTRQARGLGDPQRRHFRHEARGDA
jgi:predicted amidohydrolase YtcJ